MRKLFLHIALLLTALCVNAQNVLFEQSLTTRESFNNFTIVSQVGDNHIWFFNPAFPQNGAIMSGYTNPNSFENVDWLISPEIYLSGMNNVRLTFDHTRGSAAVINVGMAEGWYKVFATAHYTGDPATTQWIELEGVRHATTAWQFVSSGELAIPEAAQSASTRIAFRYESSNTQSATWEVKNMRVTGVPTYVSEDGVFKITTLNTTFLGCPIYPPDDDELQLNNIVSVIQMINPDIIALQEVSQNNDFQMINEIVSRLGSEWGGAIAASDINDCGLNQGIIYKKAKVQIASSLLLSSGTNFPGFSYYVNWASGRFPAVYNVNLVVGSELVPVSLVNIHAKAMSDENSYWRRRYASEALKTILDSPTYNANNVIILGDFNDYLEGTICFLCVNVSPYQNFMDDTDNYRALTGHLWSYNPIFNYYFNNPAIDHIIISDELFDNYVPNSTKDEIDVVLSIANYGHTTSTHVPISALFEFSLTNRVGNVYAENNILQIYPNPVKEELNINNAADMENFMIFDLLGKQHLNGRLNGSSINVGALFTGVYILRIGNQWGKFVKE